MEDTGLRNNIDIILKRFEKDIVVWERDIKAAHATDTEILIDKMIMFDIIKLQPYPDQASKSYTLTALGHEVKQSGSWTKYLADKAEEKRLANEMVNSTITTNKTTKTILYITILISLVSIGISWLDYQETKSKQTGQKKSQHKSKGHHHRNQETVRPNSDSSANSAADSLQ